MSEFTCYFLDRELDVNPKLENYSDFFLNYHPSKWKRGCGDAIFNFVNDKGDSAVLTMIECEKFGISIRYNFRRSNERKGEEFYSIGEVKKINLVKDVGDDQFVPVGSFVQPEIAWRILEDFFCSPLDKTNQVQWIKSENITGF